VEGLHGICHYVHEHLKVTSDRTKTRYDNLAKSVEFQEKDQVWLQRPTVPEAATVIESCLEGGHLDQGYYLHDPGHHVVNIWFGNWTH
jgi:hypothetical protein